MKTGMPKGDAVCFILGDASAQLVETAPKEILEVAFVTLAHILSEVAAGKRKSPAKVDDIVFITMMAVASRMMGSKEKLIGEFEPPTDEGDNIPVTDTTDAANILRKFTTTGRAN